MKHTLMINWRWILGFSVAGFLLSTESLLKIFTVDGPWLSVLYAVYVMCVCAMFGLFAGAVSGTRRWVSVVFLAFLAAFFLFSLRFNFIDAVLELSARSYLISFLATWVVLCILLWFGLNEVGRFDRRFVVAVYSVLAAPLFIQAASVFGVLGAMSRSNVEIPHVPQGGSLSNGWPAPVFYERPNIYLLAFDSLIPDDVAKEYMGIEDLSYYSLVPSLLTEVPRAMVTSLPSMESLKSVMRFDQGGLPSRRGLDAFAGNVDSLLAEIARLNSYRLITAWPGYVPPWERGPYVHETLSARSSFQGERDGGFLCEFGFTSRKILVRGVFFCAVFGFFIKPGVDDDSDFVFRDVVLARAVNAASEENATIFFSYVFDPIGHAEPGYDHGSVEDREAYRERFLSQADLARVTIENFVSSIRQKDPQAIVLVFGDHGASLSSPGSRSRDPVFYFTDRYRVFMGVAVGGHRCSRPPLVSHGGDYNTPSRWLLDVIRCLSSAQEEFDVEFEEDPALIRYVRR